MHNIFPESVPSDAVLVLPSSSMAAVLKALTPLPRCQVLPVFFRQGGSLLVVFVFLVYGGGGCVCVCVVVYVCGWLVRNSCALTQVAVIAASCCVGPGWWWWWL